MNDMLLKTEKYQYEAVELTAPQKRIDIELSEYEEDDGFRFPTEAGGKKFPLRSKKFRIALIVALIVLAPVLYFNSLSGRIVVKNPYSGISGISNVVCYGGMRKALLISFPFFDSVALYNRADYGEYNYFFNIQVDGKTYRPNISYFKTDWWSHEKFNVTVEIVKNGDTYDAIVSFNEYCTKRITDIEHNEIVYGLGP